MTTVAPRKRLATNIDGIVASTTSLTAAIRSLRETKENTTVIPGWRVVHPDPSELNEIREVQVLESQPGDDYPYILPRDANTTVMVESGAIGVYDDNGEHQGDLEPGQLPHFVRRGSACSIRAVTFPTTVLLVSYRERASGGRQQQRT